MLIHQEPNRAELHAIHRQLARQRAMHAAQHEAVTTEGYDHIRFLNHRIAIASGQHLERGLRFVGACRHEGDARVVDHTGAPVDAS